jgi:hypothetical protein
VTYKKPITPLFELFSRQVRVGDGCWRWTGYISNGYGKLKVGGRWPKGKLLYAHRVSYKFFRGPIRRGKVIDHLCNNRWCVKPSHMRVTTHRVNILRGNSMSARHVKKTGCPYGHGPYDMRDVRFRNGRRIIQRGCTMCKSRRDKKYHAAKVKRRARLK